MAQTVSDASAFASVLLESYHSQDVVELIFLRKLQHDVYGLVFASVVDNQDLVTRGARSRCSARMSLLALAGIGLSATRAAKLLVQVFNYLL